MTDIINNGGKEYAFRWCITNYSCCWHKCKEVLSSPRFITVGMQNTAWRLKLYPRGLRDTFKNNISLYLLRDEDDSGPRKILLKCRLSVLAADGSTLHSEEFEKNFEKAIGCGSANFLPTDEVVFLRKAEYLPQDTLSLLCKIWQGEENIQPVTHIYARTHIRVQRISFLQIVENFSSVKTYQKKTVKVPLPSKHEWILSSNIYFTNNACCEEKIMVAITPSNTELILSKYRLSLLDGSGTAFTCGETRNRYEAATKEILELPLSLTRKAILNSKSTFLQDDKLSVLCELVFTSGVLHDEIEKILYEIPSASLNEITFDNLDKESADDFSSALVDLENVYREKILTDVELKTDNQSFPAHKTVLCARSPVFKAMLSNSMLEKNTNCIKIEDLDNETIQHLLLFFYSDKLEDLRWELVTKLYYASDKYQVEKLKGKCSDFLINNLSTVTASKLLLLADTHNDNKLKNVAENFILENEEEVFCSDEWENLIETNPQLVIKTMHLKYRRNKCLK